jgi:glycosyltransferase involved in cell wall biosynthesis
VRTHRILIVSYLFPPHGGIAVQRALSFAKYLPRHGCEVHVLTARNAAAPVKDPGLLKHVPGTVQIHDAFTPELPFGFRQKLWSLLSGGKGKSTRPSAGAASPSSSLPARLIKRILCPEPEILWVPFALRKARSIVRKHGIDTVLVTVPPFSALLVGTGLKRKFPEIKLVSDFRDEWLSFYLKDFEFQSGDRTRRRAEQIERASVESSDLVVAVTPTSLAEIRNRYPEQPDRKFACIHNGYDPEVFAGFTARRHESDRLVVTHLGTAYKTASPRYYLDALDGLPEETRSRIETRFIGRVSENERALLEGRKSLVRLLGFMPQAEALRWVEETDYLLLTMTNDISLPGKLFEYLATGKPILALSPAGGEVDRILRETRAGGCVDPYDPAAVRGMLRTALENTANGFRPDWDAIRRFERPRLVEELVGTMETRLWKD